MTATFPQIIWLTERKEMLFIMTAILLAVSYYLMKKSEQLTCPIDKKDTCESVKGFSKKVYFGTVMIYFVGLTFAYILPRFM